MSVRHGDLFDVLPTLDAESIDACVTDPPYGIAFMGKTWDDHRTEFEAWTNRWALEVFRVLKPGAHMLAFGAPRNAHRMICGIEDAGFEIRDSLCWLFGSGFPKSLNISKALDAAAGAERVVVAPDPFAGKRGRSDPDPNSNPQLQHKYGSFYQRCAVTLPATDPAKQWEGWGTALKPAYEPIILARKPFKGTVAANVEKHGTGAINIDACRIEATDFEPKERLGATKIMAEYPWNKRQADPANRVRIMEGHALGRWPANVLLDEDSAALLDDMVGPTPSSGRHGESGSGKPSGIFGIGSVRQRTYFDDGNVSRFFYVAKPSRSEREEGIYDLEPRQRDDSRKDGNTGGDNPRNRGLQRRGNHHPTVKPVELMRWLVRLVTPPGGTVLDPFCGSGTTGMACAYELRPFIGIEREAEYVEIATRRISACAPLFQNAGGDR